MAKFDPATTALVLIEFQHEFTSEGGKLHDAVKEVMASTQMLDHAKQLLAAARADKMLVCHCPISFSEEYHELEAQPYGILANVKAGGCFKASDWGSALVEGLTPAHGEVTVAGKRGLCGFASTNLDFILRHNGINTILLAGFLTNCCVESTMRAGYEKGYQVVTIPDACAATSQEAHDAAVKFTFPMFSTPLTTQQVLDRM